MSFSDAKKHEQTERIVSKLIKGLKKIFYRSIENKEISYKELNEFIKNKGALLIDVRSSQEYDEDHINGAINIPLYNIKKEIEKIAKDKNQIIILYCATGARSKKAKTEIEKLGYENVYNLKGGIDSIWTK